MNNQFVVILIIFLLISINTAKETADSGELTIILRGFENDDGMAMIALSNTQEDYEAKDDPYRGNSTKIVNKLTSWTISDLPYGEYAIKVFHDEDEDGDMDTNFFGAPSEDYGFSNDARGSFGPASWEDAKFVFKLPRDTVYINVE
jgi:uncharacterized protein (DUF2141 family)